MSISISPVKFTNALLFCLCIMFPALSFGQTVTSFSPSVVTRGTQVVITGTGFTSAPTVKFGGTNATILSYNSTQIRAVVTTGASGNVSVTIGSVTRVAPTGTITYRTPATTATTAAVTRIVTDFDGYWTSSTSARNTNLPDNRHNLMAFTHNGTLYSTGVNDASLTSHSDVYTQRVFKAFSTDGITGNTGINSSNFIALGSKVDGSTTANYLSPAVAGLTVRDVLIDGINGLDLGTGVTNVTSSMVMAYKVSNIVPGAITDNEPDVLITQTAEPTNTDADIYSFIDVDGNIVGKSISANLSQISHVGTYKLDLFTLPNNIPYETAVPSGNAGSNTTREIRLIAFKLSEFGITAANYHLVDKFKLMPSGSSDPAFIAYNANSFLISVPNIVENPASAIVCTGTTSTSVTFSVTATGPDLTYQWKKNNINIPGATNASYTIVNPSIPGDLASYSVVVSNSHGTAVSAPANLTLGTGDSIWDGTSWTGGTPTAQKNIIFNGNYTSTGNLTGCSCKVNDYAVVTVLSNHTMTLENHVEVAPEATIRFNDAASLLQRNNAAVNSGKIEVIRNTKPVKRYDYTYWSSPVSPQSLHDLSPDTAPDKYYKYDAVLDNWAGVPSSTIMEKGTGYIIRAPQSHSITAPTVYTAKFIGTPNSGEVYVKVQKGTNKSNLIGNPYPSGIDAGLFLNDPANAASIGGTIYFWTHATSRNASRQYAESDYAKWNLTGPVKATSPSESMPTGIIASGQSFFVEGAPGAGASNAVFKNYMRTATGNNQFFRNSNTANSHVAKHRFWLNIQNEEGAYNQMLVGYISGATNGYDRDFDGRNFGENVVKLYSILEDDHLAIQGRALPFQDTESIPLGYTATIAGNLTIALEQFDGVFQNQDIYLKDNLLDVTHDLKTTAYHFSTAVGAFNDRFEIVYKTELLSVQNPTWNQEAVNVYKKDSKIVINAGTVSIQEIQLFDLQGRLVYENKEVNATKTEINGLPASGQVFIIQLKNAAGVKITKKIIY